MSLSPFSHTAFPTHDEQQFRELRELLLRGQATIVSPDEQSRAIPAAIQDLLVQALAHLEHGDAVTLVPQQHTLTLQEAADILGCSQPYLAELVEEGRLPSHLAGSQRQVYLAELLAFRYEQAQQRREALGRMARREVEEGTYDTFLLPNA